MYRLCSRSSSITFRYNNVSRFWVKKWQYYKAFNVIKRLAASTARTFWLDSELRPTGRRGLLEDQENRHSDRQTARAAVSCPARAAANQPLAINWNRVFDFIQLLVFAHWKSWRGRPTPINIFTIASWAVSVTKDQACWWSCWGRRMSPEMLLFCR